MTNPLPFIHIEDAAVAEALAELNAIRPDLNSQEVLALARLVARTAARATTAGLTASGFVSEPITTAEIEEEAVKAEGFWKRNDDVWTPLIERGIAELFSGFFDAPKKPTDDAAKWDRKRPRS